MQNVKKIFTLIILLSALIFLMYVVRTLIRFGNNTIVNNVYNNGTTSTGGNIITGVMIDFGSGGTNTGVNEKINEEYYITLKEVGNYRSFFPPRQGIIGSDYSTNNQVMNGYLSNNTFQFSLPKKPQKGYLYIRLKNPTNNTIFVYWHGSDRGGYKVSGELDNDKKYMLSETEYLYSIDKIPYERFYDAKKDVYNRQEQMNIGNSNYIAVFVRDYDGSNQVEELTVARE